MITWNDSKNKIILGYHDKDKNRVGIVENKYPLEFNSNSIPFLTTRDSYFEFNPQKFSLFLKKSENEKYFNDIKVKFANILIIPGLFISIIYLIRYLGIVKPIVILETFAQLPIINTFFWISFLGVIILWHDYYQSKSIFTKLPKLQHIPDNEIEDIKAQGFKFSRYGQLDIYRYISKDYIDTVLNFKLKLYEIFLNLLNDDSVIELLKRADININQEILSTNRIDIKSFPENTITVQNSLLMYSLKEALLTKSKEIIPIHLFLAFLRVFPNLNKVLTKLKSSSEILREVATHVIENQGRIENYGYLNPQIPYYPTGGLARNWIYGYTFILNQFSKDINEEVAKQHDTFGIGHETEVENLVSILGRANRKHALLIGDAGVGKSSLIKGLAQRINKGDVPVILHGYRIVQLDINGLIAYSSRQKNIEFFIQKAMKELSKAGNVILYIDELQELIPTKAQETGHSIADILLPYITDGKFAVVGTVNFADYKKYFYTNESFRQSFSNIEVSELSPQDSLQILNSKVKVLERIHKIFITFPSLLACVELAQRYINNRMLPDSAVALLEDTASWAGTNSVNILRAEHVSKVISLQKNIQVGEITQEESTKLISLEERLKQKVIGQDEAVHLVSEALRRARTDIRDSSKPIGVFLFLGPTGVGKTYLAKMISQEYFESTADIVRVDMSEYMEESSIDKLLGSTQNTSAQTQVTLLDKIKVNPYTVVLFDEIEKANSKILDIFLQLFDEGRLTSNNGETIDFTNTIIVCTSNIGSSRLLQSLEEKVLWEETKSMVLMELKQSIRPELFNRFDSIIVFHPQKIEELAKITDLLLIELNKRLNDKGISLNWESQIPMLIANKAYQPGFGARPLKRYIQEKIEGQIATKIISGEINTGDTVTIEEKWIV